jgi:lipase chaperone LimK
MNKNKIIAVAGLAILLFIIMLSLAIRKKGNEGSLKKESTGKEGVSKEWVNESSHSKWYLNRNYIIQKKYEFKLKDIQEFYEGADFSDENIKNYFAENIINCYTLKFLKSMDNRFKDSKDLDDHLEKARQYLYSVLPSGKAGELFELYKTYLNHQIDLYEKMRKLGLPLSVEEVIADLRELQEYRRNVFGKEIADTLFGAGVKAAEYPIRRSAIMADANLYGAEKENRLEQLDRDMWGDEADSVGDSILPYTRYQEKIQIYQKDLSEMRSEEAKQAKIREFRREIFTPDQVQRLDEVDRIIADEKKKKEDYVASESAIKNSPNLSDKEKEKKIRELQDKTFGEEADAFRRREAIRAGTEQFLAEHLKR